MRSQHIIVLEGWMNPPPEFGTNAGRPSIIIDCWYVSVAICMNNPVNQRISSLFVIPYELLSSSGIKTRLPFAPRGRQASNRVMPARVFVIVRHTFSNH